MASSLLSWILAASLILFLFAWCVHWCYNNLHRVMYWLSRCCCRSTLQGNYDVLMCFVLYYNMVLTCLVILEETITDSEFGGISMVFRRQQNLNNRPPTEAEGDTAV